MEDFRGPIYHTGEWPHDGVDFTGLRVGVIGTGSSAIQSIPIIAQQAAQLTVFQRTATWSVPARNEGADAEEYLQAAKARLSGTARQGARAADRLLFPVQHEAGAGGQRPAEREKAVRGGLGARRPAVPRRLSAICCSRRRPTTPSPISPARKIRGIVKDPATAELLCPQNVFGCKRLCVDTDYFETYNLPHVKLVDVSKTPIERFTADGIVVDGTEYPARRRGFRHRLCRDDRLVRQDQDHRPQRPDARREMARRPARLSRPRLGGLSESVHDHRSRQPVGAGQHDPGDRAACRLDGRLHGHMRDIGAATIEPLQDDEDAWVEHVNDVSTVSLRSTCSSWYVGTNIPGRPRVFMPYIGGFPVYVQKCNEVMSNGYRRLCAEGRAPGQCAAAGAA